MPATQLQLLRQGPVAVLRMHTEDGPNVLSTGLLQQLLARLREVAQDRTVRAVLLCAEGRAFCAGADLTALQADAAPLGPEVGHWMRELANPLVQALHDVPVPVVSAVNGACAGGGVGLALAADLVLVGRSAFFVLPYVPRLGLVPDTGASWFLQRALGRARALGLALTGDRLDGARAVQWGLAWDCVDDKALQAGALQLAQRLAQLPPGVALEARRAIDAAAGHTLADQLADEAQRQQRLVDTPAFRDGVRAFLAQREPRLR